MNENCSIRCQSETVGRRKSTSVFRLLAAFVLMLTAQLAIGQYKGKVTDETGKALPGISVSLKNGKGTVTNEKGEFSLNVKPGTAVVFSGIGFEKQEATSVSTFVTITLKASSTNLNDVVVTGLGINRQQRSLGYASTTINSSQIVETAPTNFATAMYGKAPGVQISAAPGGSTSGVYIQVRGLNSILNKTTPLIIMDGIPIHDGDFNNSNYWADQRVRGNAILDLNPEDIESITVLKGASASALYGSEANNGVLVITTKNGKGKKGWGVDVNLNYFQDKVAYLPDYQNVRGAGFPAPSVWGVYGPNDFGSATLNGQTYRTEIQGSLNFGPVFDGKPILTWDGVVRPYSAQKNRYDDLYQVAHNSTENIAFSNSSDNSSTRFSMTHQHTEGLSLTSFNEKVAATLNSQYKFGSKVTFDVVANYIWQKIHDRPYSIDRMVNNFTGMMPVFDNGAWYQSKYQTSLGYKYVTGTNPSLTPNENIMYANTRTDILDYMWNVNKNISNEYDNRLISSFTGTWAITNNFKFRGRLGSDLTFNRNEGYGYSSTPASFGNPTGNYAYGTDNYNILYGDLLLTYNTKLSHDLGLTAMGGYTGEKQSGYSNSVGTNGGLSTDNWFDLAASYLPVSGSVTRTTLVKDAFLGTVNLNYRSYLYAEGTLRRDRTSTMFPTNNAFVYPSINSGFVLSDAVKLPSQIEYLKLRASWGIVGNYPSAYQANVAYNPGNLGIQAPGTAPVLTTSTQNPFGNDQIKPEQKHEAEFGVEAKFLKGRLGMDLSYYSANVVNQMLKLQIPMSSGAGSILTNIGTLSNRGVELSLQGTPVQGKYFRWNVIFNYATNKNKVVKLTTNSNVLELSNSDGDAWSLDAYVGRPMGDIYSHPTLKNATGQNIIDGSGLYQADPNKKISYGNVQAKGSGGLMNSFSYKNFTLDLMADFRYGGSVIPTGIYWMTSRGITKESLDHMDKAHGGLSYYVDQNTQKGVQTNAAAGPHGELVMNDGMLLPGVTSDGKVNTNVISQANYFWNTYNWGGPQYSPNSLYNLYIHRNDYIKMREMSLSYTLSSKVAGKIRAKRMVVSVFARNFFYIYRTLKNMDAEQLTTGTSWFNNASNAGSQPSSRSMGVMLRTSF